MSDSFNRGEISRGNPNKERNRAWKGKQKEWKKKQRLEKGNREETKVKSVGRRKAGNSVSQLSESQFPSQLSHTHTCTQAHTTYSMKVILQKSTDYNSHSEMHS